MKNFKVLYIAQHDTWKQYFSALLISIASLVDAVIEVVSLRLLTSNLRLALLIMLLGLNRSGENTDDRGT